MLASNATEHDAIQQGIATEAVVAMDTASDLTCSVEARNGLAIAVDHCRVRIDLQTTHAVMDHWCDDGHVERLGLEGRAWDDVVVELLARSCLATGGIPRLTRWVGWVRSTVRILLCLLGSFVVVIVRLLQGGQRHAHVLGQCLTRFVELHDATASVMLAMPDDLVGGSLVQAEPEGRLVLPHLTSHIVPSAELIRETLAVGIQHQTSDASQGLGSQELDLGIWVIWLHQTSWVDLNPLQIDGLAANFLSHLDAITCAMLAVRGWKVHEVGPVLRQKGILREICTKPARAEDDRTFLGNVLATLLVHQACDCSRRARQQLVGLGLGDNLCLVATLCDLLDHLNQSICDGHAWETLLSTMRTGHRVAAETRDERQVKIELLHQPIYIGTAVAAENLHDLGPLGAALQGIRGEQLNCVINALRLLSLRLCAIDATGCLGRVSSAERGLVHENHFCAILQDGVGSGHTSQTSTNHDGSVPNVGTRKLCK